MKKISIGFLFSNDRSKVLLMKRVFEEYDNQQLFTGIGGHVDEGEDSFEAMFREFIEEAGIVITDWELFAELMNDGMEIRFFRAFSDSIFQNKTLEDDTVIVCSIPFNLPAHPNLKWLIPLALDFEPKITKIYYE